MNSKWCARKYAGLIWDTCPSDWWKCEKYQSDSVLFKICIRHLLTCSMEQRPSWEV